MSAGGYLRTLSASSGVSGAILVSPRSPHRQFHLATEAAAAASGGMQSPPGGIPADRLGSEHDGSAISTSSSSVLVQRESYRADPPGGAAYSAASFAQRSVQMESSSLAYALPLAASGSAASVQPPASVALPNASVTLLRLELDQKKHALDAAKRTVLRLQDDLARVAHEHDTARRSDSDRRDAAIRQVQLELDRERQMAISLREELDREGQRWQTAHRAASDAELVRLELTRLQARNKETESSLAARTQEAAAVKLQLDATVRDHATHQDLTAVLTGKVQALEQLVQSKDSELVGLQNALSAEAQRLRAAQDEHHVLTSMKGQLEHDLGAAHIDRGEMEKQAAKDKQAMLKLSEALQQARDSVTSAESTLSDREVALGKEMAALRDELRSRQHAIHDLQYTLVEKDKAVAAQESQCRRLDETIAYQNSEVQSLAERLGAMLREVERLEGQAAEDGVAVFDLRAQVAQKKATLEALSRENQELLGANRVAADAAEGLRQQLTELQGIDERHTVLTAIHGRTEADLERAQSSCFTLQEKVATLEGELVKASRLEGALQDMERTYRVCREEVEALLHDKRMLEGREAAMREDLGELRARSRVTDAKLQAEEERRRDLERKVQLLESLSSSAYGMHGKYMALQQFIHTSTSDVAKAMELNSTLLQEIRGLEEKCDAQDRAVVRLTEEQRQTSIRVAEVDVLRRDHSIALQRVQQVERLLAEGQQRAVADDASRARQRELEQLLVDATARGTHFQTTATRQAADYALLQGQLDAQRDDHRLQLLRVEEQLRQATSAVSLAALPVTEAAQEQQQTIERLTAALDQQRLDLRQDQLRLREDLQRRDDAIRQLQRDLEEARIPPPPPVKPQSSPQGQQVSFLKYECGRLQDELEASKERLVEQETRMERLGSQLAVALLHLKELRGGQTTQSAATAFSTGVSGNSASASPPQPPPAISVARQSRREYNQQPQQQQEVVNVATHRNLGGYAVASPVRNADDDVTSATVSTNSSFSIQQQQQQQHHVRHYDSNTAGAADDARTPHARGQRMAVSPPAAVSRDSSVKRQQQQQQQPSGAASSTALSVAQQQHVLRMRGGAVSPPEVRSPVRQVRHEILLSSTFFSAASASPSPILLQQSAAAETHVAIGRSGYEHFRLTQQQQQHSSTGSTGNSSASPIRSGRLGGSGAAPSGFLDDETRQRIAELFRSAQVNVDTPPASSKSRPQHIQQQQRGAASPAGVWSPTRR